MHLLEFELINQTLSVLPAHLFAEFLLPIDANAISARQIQGKIDFHTTLSENNMELDMHIHLKYSKDYIKISKYSDVYIHLKYSKDCIKISFPNVQTADKKPFSLSPRNCPKTEQSKLSTFSSDAKLSVNLFACLVISLFCNWGPALYQL